MKPKMPSPAMLVALLALFVAIGGVSYAATQLPKNSVGAKQLKKNSVTSKKLKKSAVTAKKIKKGAISTAKIAKAAVTADKIAPGVIPAASTNAQTLGGFAADGLLRTAFAFSVNPNNKSGQTTILSTNITAPSKGYLVVNASTDVRSVTDEFADCVLEVDDVGMSGGSRFMALKIGTAHPETVCPTNATAVVAAGSHKVDLEGMGADPDVKWGRGSLQATFIPFGATGNQP